MESKAAEFSKLKLPTQQWLQQEPVRKLRKPPTVRDLAADFSISQSKDRDP
jgi:hypothetical protein